MTKLNSCSVSIITIVAILCGIALLDDLVDSFSGKTTIYHSRCIDSSVEYFKCAPERLMSSSLTFKADYSKQAVFKLGTPLRSLSACIVADYKNWRCDDGSTTILMNDGSYMNYVNGDSKVYDAEIPAIRYWFLRMRDMYQ